MNPVKFRKLTKKKLKLCVNVLEGKRLEYSREVDRFFNFDWTAKFLGTTKPFACLAIASKHFASIALDIRDIEIGRKVDTKRTRNRKITDAINYLLILEGILKEEEDRHGKKDHTHIASSLNRLSHIHKR
jgi:hypothetical protein